MTSPSNTWDRVEVIQIDLTMVEPLATAHGTTDTRPLVLVLLERDGIEGWGECVALPDASYDGESSDRSFEQLSAFFARSLEQSGLRNSAAYAYDMAREDHRLKGLGRSLAGRDLEPVVPCAVVGLGTTQAVFDRITRQLEVGYRQIKLKVTPETVDQVGEAVAAFPACLFRVDANGSFDWGNSDHQAKLKRLTGFDLASIEQPFAVGSEDDNVELEKLGLRAALDESVADLSAARRLASAGFTSLVVKPYRFKSIEDASAFADAQSGTSLSIGGMIDGPLSRAVNIALAASIPFRSQPAEIAVDGRWFARSYSSTEVAIENGMIAVPQEPGVGAVVDRNAVDDMTKRSNAY